MQRLSSGPLPCPSETVPPLCDFSNGCRSAHFTKFLHLIAFTYLFEVFLGSSLGLFGEAPKFVSFELQGRHVFLHSSPKLQILLPLCHQFDQAFKRGLIVARVGQLAHLHAPANEGVSGERALLLKKGFLVEMREG